MRPQPESESNDGSRTRRFELDAAGKPEQPGGRAQEFSKGTHEHFGREQHAGGHQAEASPPAGAAGALTHTVSGSPAFSAAYRAAVNR